MNGTDLDIEFAEGSKIQVPTPGSTDKAATKDYIEFMTHSEMIPMSRVRISGIEDSEDDDAEEPDDE